MPHPVRGVTSALLEQFGETQIKWLANHATQATNLYSSHRGWLLRSRWLYPEELLPLDFEVLHGLTQQFFELTVPVCCTLLAGFVTDWHDTPPENPYSHEIKLRTWIVRLVLSAFAVK